MSELSSTRRILVADDDPERLQALVGRLQREGFDVLSAQDGLEALDRAREDVPDAIILNLLLRRIDGLRVCEILKSNPATTNIPVLLMAGVHVDADEGDDGHEEDRRPDDPVEDGEDAHPEQVHGPRDRGHERVLDRPLPALPGDGLREDLEDDPEVGPDHGADQQDRGDLLDVDVAAGRRDALRDEDDRERVRDRPDKERDVPPDVALDEVDVPLDHAAEPDQLVAQRKAHGSHDGSPPFSNAWPLAAKNASSSVSAP